MTPLKSAWRQIDAYARLGRMHRVDNILGICIAWAFVPGDSRSSVRTIEILLLCLGATVAIVAASGALDAVQGLRDGTDAINYAAGSSGAARSALNKPLLDGRIDERGALAFAAVCVAVGAVLALIAAAASTRDVTAITIGGAFVAALAIQYSFGLKVTYWGGMELFVVLIYAATVVLTSVVAGSDRVVAVLAGGFAFGLLHAQVAVFSNTHDRIGDLHASRKTLAVLLSDSANRAVMIAIFLAGWVAGATIVITERALVPAVFWLLLVALQGQQLARGVREDYLGARQVGFWALRIGVCWIVAAAFASA